MPTPEAGSTRPTERPGRDSPPPSSRFPYILFLLLAVAILITFFLRSYEPRERRPHEEKDSPYPSDWFAMQRAFPSGRIDQEAYRAAVEQSRVERAAALRGARAGAGPEAAQAGPLEWQPVGPYNIGGRVTALAVVPGGATVYLGAANGGVFKSVNGGVNWTPVFDAVGAFSIGALCLDPGNSDVVYCGTGEANGAVDTYDGAGLFRSPDGGGTWGYLGLAETRRIARVAVDPANSSRIFVAAMGSQFSTDPNRGLYRSEDGGATWSKVLFVSDSTGACDVAVNPAHPETVFCATWERIRRPTYRRVFGPEGGIWRSADHGTTWARVTAGLPAPSDSLGRIGLALVPSRPSTIYAQIMGGPALALDAFGLYRSQDGGKTWSRRDASGFVGSFGGFGWYFGDLAVHPTNPDRVYCLGVDFIASADGGSSFTSFLGGGASAAHVDQHAIWIDPANPARIYLGNDGGFYSSTVGGGTWTKSVDLPITQFYDGAIDPSNPARLLGGTQDNFTLLTTGSPTGWVPILGGDGFCCLVDPVNPNVLFAEWQFMSEGSGPQRSTNGGSSFSPPGGFSPGDRYNWNAPFVMNPRNHNTLLAGSQRVYKSLNNGVSYSAVSGDLTTNRGDALLTYSTITTLEIAPADTLTYYVGTDDAKVWRTVNGGSTWTDISAGLPTRWVTRVASDPRDAHVVYVTLSGYSLDEHAAHVYRSVNGGDTWTAVDAGLPDVPVNDLVIDPSRPDRLYAGNDIGVYASDDDGATWYPLGTGLPMQAVFDLTVHDASRTLVAATHGRSQWKLDLSALPVAVGPRPLAARLALSTPAPNPTRGATSFSVEVPAGARLDVDVFDVMGRRVRALFHGAAAGGRREMSWGATDDAGRRVGAGVYYLRAAAGPGGSAMRKIVILG